MSTAFVRGSKKRIGPTPSVGGSKTSRSSIPTVGGNKKKSSSTPTVKGSGTKGSKKMFDQKLPTGAKIVTQSVASNGIGVRVVATKAGEKRPKRRPASRPSTSGRVTQIPQEEYVQPKAPPVIEAKAADSEPEMVMGGAQPSLPSTSAAAKPEPIEDEEMEPGTYWSDKFERYIAPGDPEYSEETARRVGAI